MLLEQRPTQGGPLFRHRLWDLIPVMPSPKDFSQHKDYSQVFFPFYNNGPDVKMVDIETRNTKIEKDVF
jgi:hypothetical protein